MAEAEGAKRSEAEEWLFYLLFQVVRRRDAAFAQSLAEIELDLARWRVLSVVRRVDDCTMNELAEFTTVDRTTLTRTVDHLETAGLVARNDSPADRRRVCLALTPAGLAAYEAALERLRAYNTDVLRGVDEQELLGLRAVLAKIVGNIAGSEDRARAIVDFARS